MERVSTMLNYLQELQNQYIGELRMLSRMRRKREGSLDRWIADAAEREVNAYYYKKYRNLRSRSKPTGADVLIAFIVGWAVFVTVLAFL